MAAMQYRAWREFLESILIAVFLALFVRTFLLTGYKVTTVSMAPQILPGDFVMAFRLSYGVHIPLTQKKLKFGQPKIDQVVIFSEPGFARTNFIRRVKALSGDRVEVKEGQLLVNDLPVRKLSGVLNWGPLIVPPEEVFLLADQDELEQVSFGTVPVAKLEGRVLLIWLSLNWEERWLGSFPSLRWERQFKPVH